MIEQFTLFSKPIHVVVAENHGEEAELPMVTGYYELPNKDLYPHNLFQFVTGTSKDIIGLAVFKEAFRYSQDFVVTEKSVDLTPNSQGRVLQILDQLNMANLNIEKTEISLHLLKVWESSVSEELRWKYPHSLVQLQKTLNLKKINCKTDIPQTNSEIMKLLADIRNDPATSILVEAGLGLTEPSFLGNTVVGYGYDVFKDISLKNSPFKPGEFHTSDIGFRIPNYVSCNINPKSYNNFFIFRDKNEFIKRRRDYLGVTGDISHKTFAWELKSGYNIEHLSLNKASCEATAVRNYQSFEFRLNISSKRTETFELDVRGLSSFDEHNYGSVVEWEKFFAKYGTHVIESAFGGGSIEVRITDSKFCNEEGMYSLLELLVLLEENVASSPLLESIQAALIKGDLVGPHTLTFNGGDSKAQISDLSKVAPLEAAKMLNDWKESLKFNPAVLSTQVRLVPINHIAKQMGKDNDVKVEQALQSLFKGNLKYKRPIAVKVKPLAREDTPYVSEEGWFDYIFSAPRRFFKWIGLL